MRYISHIDHLVLYSSMLPPQTLDPTAAPMGYRPLYRFFNGELIVGDPTTGDGAGNSIDFGTSSTPPEQRVQRIFPTDLSGRAEGEAGVNIAELCGLNRLFWEAPLINIEPGGEFEPQDATGTYRWDPLAPPLTYAVRYRVLRGTVTYNGRTYRPVEDGQQNIIRLTDTSNITAGPGGATIALHVPEPAERERLDQMRDILFRWKHLLVGDEAAWDITQPGSYQGRDFGWIRE